MEIRIRPLLLPIFSLHIYNLSRDYDNKGGRDGKISPPPEAYPTIDGYVPVSSILRVSVDYKGEGNNVPTIANKDNIEFWLGDYNVNDHCLG